MRRLGFGIGRAEERVWRSIAECSWVIRNEGVRERLVRDMYGVTTPIQ